MSTPKVDICVLAHNRWDVTARFLPHLIQTTAGVPYALHLLDNGSDEPGDKNWRIMRLFRSRTRWWGNPFREWYPGLTITAERSDKNLNFSGGNNLLARKGTAPWILFLNNDAFPAKRDWLHRLVACAENGGFLAVGPTSNAVMGYQGVQWNGRLPDVHHNHVLSGFCVLVRRDAFEAIGGWDEGFNNGDEDMDLSFGLRNFAWIRDRNPAALGVNRRVFVHHECSQSLGPWCAKQGKTIKQHFKSTHEKLVMKRGERVLLDAFFVEDAKRPYNEWRNIGVLPNGTYYQQPASNIDAIRQFGGDGSFHPGGQDSSESRGTAPGGNGEVRDRVRVPALQARAQTGATGSSGQEGSEPGRRAQGRASAGVGGHDPAHDEQGVHALRQAEPVRLFAGRAEGTHRRANGRSLRADEIERGETATHQGVAGGRGGDSRQRVVQHIGATVGGGYVCRSVVAGGECCFRGMKTVLACSCREAA